LFAIADWRPAFAAGVAAAAVDGEFCASLRAAAEEFQRGGDDPIELRIIEIADARKRIDAGIEQRFRFPDVADAGDDALVE
jgi:hypothetical protein